MQSIAHREEMYEYRQTWEKFAFHIHCKFTYRCHRWESGRPIDWRREMPSQPFLLVLPSDSKPIVVVDHRRWILCSWMDRIRMATDFIRIILATWNYRPILYLTEMHWPRYSWVIKVQHQPVCHHPSMNGQIVPVNFLSNWTISVCSVRFAIVYRDFHQSRIRANLPTKKWNCKSMERSSLTCVSPSFHSSTSHTHQTKQLTFRDLICFWQCYDQLYIEQYQFDRRYSSTVIDKAVHSFGQQDYDTLSTSLSQSSSPSRLSSYRRLNSQHEYERLFQEFSSVSNDELDACLSTNGKPGIFTSWSHLDSSFSLVAFVGDLNNVAKLSLLSKLLPATSHSSPVSTDNDLNSLVADLDPHPTPNINDILANLKAGLIESNLHIPTFDESHLDLPRQRSSLTHNRLISSSNINNIPVPSVFINEVEHIRLVDLSKNLLNNLPLSTIKNYAKLLQCPIVQCPEFVRDFLMRNNRQASTSRSCFCTTLTDAGSIYAELINANVPLPPTSKDEDLLLLTKKRKHAPPKGWEDGSSDMIISVPQVKKHKPKLDVSSILRDHDYLTAEQMNNLWRRPSKRSLVTIPSPVSLSMPLTDADDELRFMECSPSPIHALVPTQGTLLLPSATALLPAPPAPPPAPSLPPPPILFKLRDYFHAQPHTLPVPTFYDAYSDERFMQITRHPLIILTSTQLDYLLDCLNRNGNSTSLLDRYHLY